MKNAAMKMVHLIYFNEEKNQWPRNTRPSGKYSHTLVSEIPFLITWAQYFVIKCDGAAINVTETKKTDRSRYGQGRVENFNR